MGNKRTAEQMVKDDDALDGQVANLTQELSVVGWEEDRKFHEFVFTELAALRTGLENEAHVREEADVRYAKHLMHKRTLVFPHAHSFASAIKFKTVHSARHLSFSNSVSSAFDGGI